MGNLSGLCSFCGVELDVQQRNPHKGAELSNDKSWLDVPDPVATAYDFIIKMNEVKLRGGGLDGQCALACTAANELLRRYFERVTDSVDDGLFDPDYLFALESDRFGDGDGQEEWEAESD